jgi:hypothetical protein
VPKFLFAFLRGGPLESDHGLHVVCDRWLIPTTQRIGQKLQAANEDLISFLGHFQSASTGTPCLSVWPSGRLPPCSFIGGARFLGRELRRRLIRTSQIVGNRPCKAKPHPRKPQQPGPPFRIVHALRPTFTSGATPVALQIAARFRMPAPAISRRNSYPAISCYRAPGTRAEPGAFIIPAAPSPACGARPSARPGAKVKRAGQTP